MVHGTRRGLSASVLAAKVLNNFLTVEPCLYLFLVNYLLAYLLATNSTVPYYII